MIFKYTHIHIYIYAYWWDINTHTSKEIGNLIPKWTKLQTPVEFMLGILRGIDSISCGASSPQALDESLAECDGAWSEVNRRTEAEPLDAGCSCQSTSRPQCELWWPDVGSLNLQHINCVHMWGTKDGMKEPATNKSESQCRKGSSSCWDQTPFAFFPLQWLLLVVW